MYLIRMYLVSAGRRTFRPWTHTSDDSYMYELSLVAATAAVSFSGGEFENLGVLGVFLEYMVRAHRNIYGFNTLDTLSTPTISDVCTAYTA